MSTARGGGLAAAVSDVGGALTYTVVVDRRVQEAAGVVSAGGLTYTVVVFFSVQD